MGYSVHIHAGIGVMIDLSDVEFEEPEASCSHHARHGNKFCPECGTPTVDEEAEGDLDALAELLEVEARSRGLMFESMGYDHEDPSHLYFLGQGLSTSDNGGGQDRQFRAVPKDEDVLTDTKQVIAAVTETLRVEWGDDEIDLSRLPREFGFHLFTRASY